MICPTRLRGFSDAYGSWKTSCISRRSGRSGRWLVREMSSPRNTDRPLRRVEQAHDRPRQRGLATTRLADQAERLPLLAARSVTSSTAWTKPDGAVDDEPALDREVLLDVLDVTSERAVTRSHPSPRARSGPRSTWRFARFSSGDEPAAVAMAAVPRHARLERRVVGALVELVRAARAEVAALRARGERRRHPADCRKPVGPRHVEPRDRAEQSPRVRVLGVVEDLVERALLDDPAGVHHEHPVGDVGHHAEVVRHEDDAGVRALRGARGSARGSAPGSSRRARCSARRRSGRSGSQESAIAIITRWRMPPENSCG